MNSAPNTAGDSGLEYSSLPDTELIDAYVCYNNITALGALMMRYRTQLLKRLDFKLGDKFLAEDAFQETILKNSIRTFLLSLPTGGRKYVQEKYAFMGIYYYRWRR